MIRPAVPGDIAALLPLVQGLAAHHADTLQANAATLFRDLFGTPPWMQALVADEIGTLAGYAALLPLARLQRGERGMDLHHLFVAEPFRGQGLGRALVQAALTHAKALDCCYLTVSAHAENAAARAYYPKLGFHAAPHAGVRFAYDLSGG